MFGINSKKHRKLSSKAGYKEGVRTTQQTEQEWIKEFGVGSLFTTHKAFEDPLYVEGVGDTALQLKKQTIAALQKQFNNV